MSELEKARAGVFLSLLVLMLTWLLISNGDGAQSSSQGFGPVALCASTHGALCEVSSVEADSAATTVATEGAHLGELVVTASRSWADMGHIVVSATRLPAEPAAKVQLAETKGSSGAAKPIVVQ